MWQIILRRKIRKRWFYNLTTTFFFLVAFASATFFVYQVIFAEKVYGGVFVGPYYLGGKTYLEAEEFLQQKTDEFLLKNLEFTTVGKKLSIELTTIADDPGFSRSLISFDTEKTISSAYSVGRGENLINNIITNFFLLFSKKTIPIKFSLDEETLLQTLRENFGPLETPQKSADLEISFKNSGKPYIKIIPEMNGRIFDFEKAIEQINKNINNFEQTPIRMALHGVVPEIKSSEINSALDGIEKIFEKTPIILKYEKQAWEINRNDLASTIIFKKNDAGEVVLGLDEKLTKKMDTIAEEINIKPKNAKFVLENDKVIEFQISEEGQTLDKEISIQKIEEKLFGSLDRENENLQVELSVREIAPLVTTESVNTMGIKEMVGVGESNFAWSPVNRRYNIAIGSQKIHGLIIAPGEEFSLNKAIGPVNAATGFKPELVIKGNETKPEYGGGLCQIATTMFRTALNAGLEITERQNHSYRVSYYEPPVGTDATIYGPHPDLRFKNNTGKSLLIQTEINGDNLKYTLWGTKDEREIVIEKPVIWNITNPPPTKIIETLGLPVGQKKCTERAHKGASVYFDYRVNLTNGEKIEKRFTSYYRPWREVCLLGVKKLSTNE